MILQRYIQTFLRRKYLLLVPIIFIPPVTLIVALMVYFVTSEEFVVSATVWVEPDTLQTQQPDNAQLSGDTQRPGDVKQSSISQERPNEQHAIAIADRLRTASFRSEIMERSGLTDAVVEGTWPTSIPLQKQLASNPLTRPLATILGFSPPATINEAAVLGMREIRDSLKVRAVGGNLVAISYAGPDPEYGQRFIEETLSLHQEQILDAKLREQQTVANFLQKRLAEQKPMVEEAQENLINFENDHPAPPPGFDRQDPNEAQELATLQQLEKTEREKYNSYRNELESFMFESDKAILLLTLPFRIIDAPVAPNPTSTISVRRLALMGILGIAQGIAIGGILGAGAIFFVTRRDKTTRKRSTAPSLI